MKLPPLSQQVEALRRARGRPFFAYFMEQGTGKAYVGLAEAESLYLEGAIELLVVIAPSGVQRNWLDREAPKLLSTPYRTLLWTGNSSQRHLNELNDFGAIRLAPNKGPRLPLRILAFNVEAFSLKNSRAEKYLTWILSRLRSLLVVDESSVIKNPSAQRTKNLVRIAPKATYRRIMTGTPVTQSPLNFYPQFAFLAPGLLGFDQYTSFKAHFAEWRERVVPSNRKGAPPGTKQKFLELVRYRNQDELKERTGRHAFTILKKDCLDLPEKVYETRLVEMGEEQSKLYAAVCSQLIAELGERRMTLAHAFTKLMRLSQITGGFWKPDEGETTPLAGPNRKIASLLQYVEEVPETKKIVVWARFTPELRAIRDALGAENCALYWGEVTGDDRNDNIDRFTTDPACRFFVGNPKSGKYGFTLTAASHVLYFSNDYSAEARWQSEDRVHRIGQTESVLYTDLTCPSTIDVKMLRILKARKEMAEFFSGSKEKLLRWLEEEDKNDD